MRLRNQGFHISHIHPSGWLSSAFYVSLPKEMEASDNDMAGAIGFGVPDEGLGLNLTPRRVILPKQGHLVLFPSYIWHGTLPFESEDQRLTVAFDALPA